jgi:hypothetical protein
VDESIYINLRTRKILDDSFGIGKDDAHRILSTEAGAKRIYDCALNAIAHLLESQSNTNPQIPDKLEQALLPFINASAVGGLIEQDVRDANPNQRSRSELIGFGGYVGQYAAQSRVSWRNWKDLFDVCSDLNIGFKPE